MSVFSTGLLSAWIENVVAFAMLLPIIKEIIPLMGVKDPEKGEEFDVAFHYAIAEATHNTLLIKLFKTVSEEFHKANSVARRKLYLHKPENAQKLIDQHSGIFEAIRSHSPEAASRAMLAHLSFAEGELRDWDV